MEEDKVPENRDATTVQTKGSIRTIDGAQTGSHQKLNLTMQLMGLPYQFLPSVDQRVSEISDSIGRKYVENIILDAPVVTFIPGKPKYLPGIKEKDTITNALISATNGNFSEIKEVTANADDDIRLYDFQSAYIEYMQYVNVLNRVDAGFLELNEADYRINGQKLNTKKQNFLNYDWKNYRWNGTGYKSITGKAMAKITEPIQNAIGVVGDLASSALKTIMKSGSSKINKNPAVDFNDDAAEMDEEEMESAENILRQTNYVQFYVDPDNRNASESLSNSTQPSMFKSALDSAGSLTKDIAFLANSGGVDAESLQELGGDFISSLDDTLGVAVSSINASAGSVLSRLMSSGKSVIKGENIIMPDIWTSSDIVKSYSISMKFKAPYGNKLSWYTDVLVPLNFCLALAYPHATTSNSYASPFLVKVYQKGEFTCNLGIISSISISKNEVPESRNMDGICTEISVELGITDLYSGMALSPANKPSLFLANTSLVEFLATTCGLDLLESQLETKAEALWNIATNAVKDISSTVVGKITQELDSVITSFTGL